MNHCLFTNIHTCNLIVKISFPESNWSFFGLSFLEIHSSFIVHYTFIKLEYLLLVSVI